MSSSSPAQLPNKRTVQLGRARVAYLEMGDPQLPTVLLVHGIPTSSQLWRRVMADLAGEFHCLAPDLMGLGDTRVDPQADLFHMDAQADMLEEFMDTLGHSRFALVCHDQGGAAAQILATRNPERISCFVITNCVCYDNWPVPEVVGLQRVMGVPVLADALARSGAFLLREAHTPFSAFRRGLFDGSRLSGEMIAEYLRPLHGDRDARRGFIRFLRAGHARYSQAVVPALRRFERPTIVLWAADDSYISPSWGHRLSSEIPGAERFELVPFCGHFWQEERPEAFVSLMAPFLRQHTLA